MSLAEALIDAANTVAAAIGGEAPAQLGVTLQRLRPYSKYLETLEAIPASSAGTSHRLFDELVKNGPSARKPVTVGELGHCLAQGRILIVPDLNDALSYDVAFDYLLGGRRAVVYLPIDAEGNLTSASGQAAFVLAVFSNSATWLADVAAHEGLAALESRLSVALHDIGVGLVEPARKHARDKPMTLPQLELGPPDETGTHESGGDPCSEVQYSPKPPRGVFERLGEHMRTGLVDLGLAMVSVRECTTEPETEEESARDVWHRRAAFVDADAILDAIYRELREASLDHRYDSLERERYARVLHQALAADLVTDSLLRPELERMLPTTRGGRFAELIVPVRAPNAGRTQGFAVVLGSEALGSSSRLETRAVSEEVRRLRHFLARLLAHVYRSVTEKPEREHLAEDIARFVFQILMSNPGSRQETLQIPAAQRAKWLEVALRAASWATESAESDQALFDDAAALVASFDQLRALTNTLYAGCWRLGTEYRLVASPADILHERLRPHFRAARLVGRFREMVRRWERPGRSLTMSWDARTGRLTASGDSCILRLPHEFEQRSFDLAMTSDAHGVRLEIQGGALPPPHPHLTFERVCHGATPLVLSSYDRGRLMKMLWSIGWPPGRSRALERRPALAARLEQRFPTVRIHLSSVYRNGGLYTKRYCEQYNKESPYGWYVRPLPRKIDADPDVVDWLRDNVLPDTKRGELPEPDGNGPLFELASTFLRPEELREHNLDAPMLVHGTIRVGGLKRWCRQALFLLRRHDNKLYLIEAYASRDPFGPPGQYAVDVPDASGLMEDTPAEQREFRERVKTAMWNGAGLSHRQLVEGTFNELFGWPPPPRVPVGAPASQPSTPLPPSSGTVPTPSGKNSVAWVKSTASLVLATLEEFLVAALGEAVASAIDGWCARNPNTTVDAAVRRKLAVRHGRMVEANNFSALFTDLNQGQSSARRNAAEATAVLDLHCLPKVPPSAPSTHVPKCPRVESFSPDVPENVQVLPAVATLRVALEERIAHAPEETLVWELPGQSYATATRQLRRWTDVLLDDRCFPSAMRRQGLNEALVAELNRP